MIEASLELIQALRARSAGRHAFVYLDHPNGAVRAWTGVGDIDWNGEIWRGVGDLGEIDRVLESGDIQSHAPAVKLNGVDPELLEFAAPVVRNRDFSMWLRWTRTDGSFFAESRLLFAGPMDFTLSEEDGTTASISVMMNSPIADWDTPANVAYTNEEQIARFPGDTGFDRVPGLADKDIIGWAAS